MNIKIKNLFILVFMIVNLDMLLYGMEQQGENECPRLPIEIVYKIADFYILDHLNTPRQFVKYLDNMLKNLRLSFRSFGLSKERILKLIHEVKNINGKKFIEKAVFKALFKGKTNIASWLYHCLDREGQFDLGHFLCPIIWHIFTPEKLYKYLDYLIGSCDPLRMISREGKAEDFKTLTLAALFILHYTNFNNEDKKHELIKDYVRALEGIAYAYDNTKNDPTIELILIKFLAKLCALGYITLEEINELWKPFFKKRTEEWIRRRIFPEEMENVFLRLSKSKEKNQEIQKLLKAKSEFYKEHLREITSGIIYNTLSNIPEYNLNRVDPTKDQIPNANMCILF